MGGEATSAGGGGFRARIDHYLYSGEKKHVLAGIVIFGAIFGVPWYFMTRGTKIILFPSHRILSTVPFLRIIAINFSKFMCRFICYFSVVGAKHQSHQDYMEKANKARSERLSSGQPSTLKE
ncbi:hypothetical protein PR202_ga27812 [Eleusine coracana subsp. coracana]|uniref:Uncharacterized protein n=1 Tax=Eleusine coracana subsp. coracana TaxID=191504 RepID=A0AAV5DI45_ELECO|nr:hypothetical protein PR202_ga27812 [Eleusine coracana subsp. coracana]